MQGITPEANIQRQPISTSQASLAMLAILKLT